VGNKLSNNKMLIVIASMLVIAIVILVIVIVKIKADDGDEKDSGSGSIAVVTTEENAGNAKGLEEDKNVEANLNVTNEPLDDGENTPTKNEEVLPGDKEAKVFLGDYKGIKAEYSPIIITDEDVESNLEYLRDENTVLVKLPNRAFEEGDMAIVSYIGKVDGKEIDEIEVVYLQVVLGKGLIQNAIEESIIGKRIGDVFDVQVEYPSDYTSIKELAGKTVVFTVELADGFEFSIPEINDSFIKEYTEYNSVSEYKTKEKERLQNEQNEIARKETENEIKHKLVDSCSFEGDIDNEIKKAYVLLLDQQNNDLIEKYWIDVETYYQLAYDYEPGEYSRMLMESVTYDIKYTYILDEIVKKENLQMTDEEFEKYLIETYMVENGYKSKEALYSEISEEMVKKEVSTRILRQKAEDLVFELAEIS